MARRAMSTMEPKSVRRLVLTTLSEMMADGEVIAGVPTRDGRFTAWATGPTATIVKIAQDWDALGRDPDIGEIVWFARTRSGPIP